MLGNKQFELTNHLGNVLATITDRKIPHNNNGTIDFYTADISSAQDYYAFGMLMPGRNFSSNSYRFGFNGKLKDDEIAGVTGADLDFGSRIYDSRVGRWLSVDPKFYKYPYFSPFSAFENNPICILDPGGDTTIYFNQKGELLHTSYDKLPTAIVVINDKKLKHFNISLKIYKGKGGADDLSSLDAPNERWRKMGKSIDVNNLREFYNDNTIVGKDNLNESGTGYIASGYLNETKANIYDKDDRISIGDKTIKGNYKNTTGIIPDEPGKGEKIGDIHTHPNEGMSDFPGYLGYGPSETDLQHHNNLDIIVSDEQIYIYGNSIKNDFANTTIVINKKTLTLGTTDKPRK